MPGLNINRQDLEEKFLSLRQKDQEIVLKLQDELIKKLEELLAKNTPVNGDRYFANDFIKSEYHKLKNMSDDEKCHWLGYMNASADVNIIFTNELHQDEWRYAICVVGTEFWITGDLPTLDDAMAYCDNAGLNLVEYGK